MATPSATSMPHSGRLCPVNYARMYSNAARQPRVFPVIVRKPANNRFCMSSLQSSTAAVAWPPSMITSDEAQQAPPGESAVQVRRGRVHADLLLLGTWQKPVPPRILDVRPARRSAVAWYATWRYPRTSGRRFGKSREAPSTMWCTSPTTPRTLVWGARGLSNWRQWFGGGIPKGERTPTGADCYRFVLAQPYVDVCLTGPATAQHVDEALEALRRGPMTPEELDWMRRVGRATQGNSGRDPTDTACPSIYWPAHPPDLFHKPVDAS